MGIEHLSTDEIKEDRCFIRNPKATHIRVEGDYFVQYKCNPHSGYGMMKLSTDIKGFAVSEESVNEYIFSRVVKTIGEEYPTTFHYQA